MTTPANQLEFFPSGPFHDVVVAYQVCLTGFLLFHQHMPDLTNVKPIGVASTKVGAIEIRGYEVKTRFLRGDFTLATVSDALARLVANWAWERAKDPYPSATWLVLQKKHPEIEFLRHLRNAASHRLGVWSFRNDEPSRLASWRGTVLTSALNGKPIWDANIQPGDILLLLHDVEQLLLASPPPNGWN